MFNQPLTQHCPFGSGVAEKVDAKVEQVYEVQLATDKKLTTNLTLNHAK